jgi:hypothetical protein
MVSWELLELHLHLTSKLSDDDWVVINCTTADKASHVASGHKVRVVNSKCLQKTQHVFPRPDIRKTVVSLSSMLLEDAAYLV